jgi:RNA polymerase sigma-70 factor (ECF subfamily)
MSALPDPNTSRSRLDQFVRRYYAPLASFFRRRTRQTADVEDLVQQVFLRLSQHPNVDAIENPDAYIFQTAANALTDHVRRKSIHARYFDDSATEESLEWGSDVSPERVLQGNQSVLQLAGALRALPERTRDVFVLRCFEGLKHVEVARLLGISVRSSEKHFAKALAQVSCCLAQESEEPAQ